MFEFAFMQRALVAAVGIGALCGALGFFVVLRRLAFVGVGISHAALGGVALAFMAGVAAWVGGLVFALVAALMIAWFGRRGIEPDTGIGILFAASMALGVALFALQPGSAPDLFAALFGNVLAVSSAELWVLAAAGASVAALLAWLFRPFLLVAFDAELAEAYGHPVLLLDAVLLMVIAAVVVLGVRLVGVILIGALLVIPAATAALWARHYRAQLALSAAFGAGAGALGLVIAYFADVPAGAAIALTSFAGFALSLAGKQLAPTSGGRRGAVL